MWMTPVVHRFRPIRLNDNDNSEKEKKKMEVEGKNNIKITDIGTVR